jgi:prepilin-type processing-associated H-X9-DG protein
MKVSDISTKSKIHGLTLIEILVVLAVVIILAVLFLYSHSPREKKYAAINCVSNLKQIGSAFGTYADDNGGKYPFQVSVANGGTMELVSNNHVFPHYQKISHTLADPKILICPFDTTRHVATTFETLTDSNISYFLNVDAMRDSPTNSILSGDRFLQDDGQPVKSGLFLLTTNLKMGWTPSIHKGGGNVLWSDGSVQQTMSEGLPSFIQSQPLATNRLLIP